MSKSKKFFVIAFVAAILGSSVYALIPRDCYPSRVLWSVQGSQGYRIWTSDVFRSFEHRNRPVCVPEGWEAIDAVSRGDGWAEYEPGHTGVLIKSEAFERIQLSPTNTSYQPTLIFPKATSAEDVATLQRVVIRAFQNVGALFPSDASAPTPHTVLATYGLSDNTLVYPDPSSRTSVYMRSAQDSRGEELLIHAVAHLYNRYGKHDHGYQSFQTPFTPEEFQEMEATWAELAYSPRELRTKRLLYLHRIHSALMIKDFDLITDAPFNDSDFAKITPRISVPEDAGFVETQYGHYVLAPLVMIGIDGMLAQNNSPVTVKALLADIHAKGEQNFLTRLTSLITPADRRAVDAWIQGQEIVPWPLVERGAARY